MFTELICDDVYVSIQNSIFCWWGRYFRGEGLQNLSIIISTLEVPIELMYDEDCYP